MHEPDEEAWAEGEADDEAELNLLVDSRLNRARPDRYLARDREWMDGIVEEVAAELNRHPRQVVLDAARRLVHHREGQATRSANRLLRTVAQTGVLPLGWGVGETWEVIRTDLLSRPLSISGERVRLGAAAAHDLDSWSALRELEAAKRNDSERETWAGARLLGSWVRRQGVSRVDDLRAPKPV
ncbi:hypothetical protein [Streptomyces sp. H27-H5]|uniref:hypothetical protein n=1 Tax=Streptomyces sp. H27-H5 TaxID=2996460 RepID=UPI00226F5D3C|nr:hypothetical protein [Streptomyces sp. H27-H5]MCY0957728.1 hypothetical protein [Streptomyces sp. H27-H5]